MSRKPYVRKVYWNEPTMTWWERSYLPEIVRGLSITGGVFLTNAEPAKFHVHTIVRTPNGNDYGIDLLRMHYEQAHRPG